MRQLDENWQPIGSVMARVFDQMEQKQRDKFVRDCAEDGVSREKVETRHEQAPTYSV